MRKINVIKFSILCRKRLNWKFEKKKSKTSAFISNPWDFKFKDKIDDYFNLNILTFKYEIKKKSIFVIYIFNLITKRKRCFVEKDIFHSILKIFFIFSKRN